jgi:Ca-activated chloride channel family protein
MKQAQAGLEQWSLVLCLLLLPGGLAIGQGTVNPAAQAPPRQSPTPGSPSQQKQGPSFRVNVRLVNVFTTVTDAHGAPIADLAKDDFRVLEDGVPQTISVFDRESELPLTIALAVDTSESTRRDLELEIASAKKFAHSVVRPVDRLAVFQITENVERVTSFTSDLRWIDRGIDNLHVGAGTSLYDAIYLAADELLDREGRKVLVLITDGGDTTSRAGYASALRRAQQAEAIVYSIIVVPIANDAGRNIGGEHALIQISKDTGGKYYYAENLNQLDEAFRQISQELRTQYLIAYYPNRQVADSPFRRIQVQVTKKDSDGAALQVRHRDGYYTGSGK